MLKHFSDANAVPALLQRMSKQGLNHHLHSPALFSIFMLSDSLAILASGRLLFHGPAHKAVGGLRISRVPLRGPQQPCRLLPTCHQWGLLCRDAQQERGRLWSGECGWALREGCSTIKKKKNWLNSMPTPPSLGKRRAIDTSIQGTGRRNTRTMRTSPTPLPSATCSDGVPFTRSQTHCAIPRPLQQRAWWPWCRHWL